MKKVIIALMIGMMIGSATVVLAADGDQVTAIFAKFDLVINGQPKVLETVPLVYNGTSYLPVRDMANLFGYDVTYKADSRTIEMNNVTGATYAPTTTPTPTPLPTLTPATPAPTPAPTPTPTSSSAPTSLAPASSVDLTGWISLRDLSTKYGVSVLASNAVNITKKGFSISYNYPNFPSSPSSNDYTLTTVTEKGPLKVRLVNYTTYLEESELINYGINQ